MVVLGAIWMGARSSGIGLGLWGAVGLMVLVGIFGITPTSPPVDVMLIILAVIMAASVMEAAGGIDFLVGVAERIIRANPKYVTIVAPLTTWTFTFLAGTGHIVYPLLPVIYETAHRSGINQVAFMAPTEILAEQHYLKLCEWLTPLGLKPVWLSGSLKKKDKTLAIAHIADGTASRPPLVPTHCFKPVSNSKNWTGDRR